MRIIHFCNSAPGQTVLQDIAQFTNVALRILQQNNLNKTTSSPGLFANESFYRSQLPLFSLVFPVDSQFKLKIRPWVSHEITFTIKKSIGVSTFSVGIAVVCSFFTLVNI